MDIEFQLTCLNCDCDIQLQSQGHTDPIPKGLVIQGEQQCPCCLITLVYAVNGKGAVLSITEK